MVTFAQAQERADEWINGDVPAYQHREVRVREFELGFVVWGEDRAEGPVSDGGRQRLVIARDSGEATLWPGLPVGEVIRRYEEEYGAHAAAVAAPEPPQRIDLNQTSFLLSPRSGSRKRPTSWASRTAGRTGARTRRLRRRPRPLRSLLLRPSPLFRPPPPPRLSVRRRRVRTAGRSRTSPRPTTVSRYPRRTCPPGPPPGPARTRTRVPTTGRCRSRPRCSRRRSRVPTTTAPRRRSFRPTRRPP